MKELVIFSIKILNKNFVYTSLHILGLSSSIAVFILIGSYIRYELSFDKHITDSDRIYRINYKRGYPERVRNVALTPVPFAPRLAEEFEEVESFALLERGFSSVFQTDVLVNANNNKYQEKRFFYGSTGLLEFFDIKMREGNAVNALLNRRSVVISRSTAIKYYGNQSAVGQHIEIGDIGTFTITGVFEDLPVNQHMGFDLLASFQDSPVSTDHRWFSTRVFSYVKLAKAANENEVEKKIPEFFLRNGRSSLSQAYGEYEEYVKAGNSFEFDLMPITDIHLHSTHEREVVEHGNWLYVVIFIIASILILFLAFINYITISISILFIRIKEINVRRVLGASKNNLILQQLIETTIVILISFIVAVFVVFMIIPSIEQHIPLLPLGMLNINSSIAYFLLTTLVGGIICGIYISKIKVRLLSYSISNSPRSGIFSTLFIFQFCISLILLSFSVLIGSQLKYMVNKDLGYDSEQLMIVELSDATKGNLEAFKHRLIQESTIKAISSSHALPGNYVGMATSYYNDPVNRKMTRFLFTDSSFVNTWGIDLAKGRNFDFKNASDSMSIILNKEAVEVLGISGNPIGKEIHTWLPNPFTVIGVTENFHFQGLHNEINPLAILILDNYARKYTAIKFDPENKDKVVEVIKNEWPNYFGDDPLNHYFFTDSFEKQYKEERSANYVIQGFTFLSLFISSLGVLGISVFNYRLRIKEIGIRKALGASFKDISSLISRHISRLVLISLIISIPISYFIEKGWLSQFAYQATIDPSNYLLSVGILATVIFLGLSFSLYKSLRLNPADTLRNE